MKRTAWALLAMSVSFLLGTIIAIGSFLSMGGRLDTTTLTAVPLSVPTILVSCLDPLAIVLEIVTIVLVVLDSKQVGNPHRRLAWAATIFFVVWGLLNLAVFLPLSFLGMQRDSLALVKTGQVVKAGAALLQYAVPFLLVYGLSQKKMRVWLWIALALTIIGNFSVVVLPISGIVLEPIETAGQILYTPQFSVDYTSGVYPLLLGMGYLGGAIYMVVYGVLTVRFFKETQPAKS